MHPVIAATNQPAPALISVPNAAKCAAIQPARVAAIFNAPRMPAARAVISAKAANAAATGNARKPARINTAALAMILVPPARSAVVSNVNQSVSASLPAKSAKRVDVASVNRSRKGELATTALEFAARRSAWPARSAARRRRLAEKNAATRTKSASAGQIRRNAVRRSASARIVAAKKVSSVATANAKNPRTAAQKTRNVAANAAPRAGRVCDGPKVAATSAASPKLFAETSAASLGRPVSLPDAVARLRCSHRRAVALSAFPAEIVQARVQ